jgi:hypothetical protein
VALALAFPAELEDPVLIGGGARSWGAPRQAATPIQNAMTADARRIL